MKQLIFLFLIGMSLNVNAQEIVIKKNGEREEIYLDRNKACDKELIFTIVEQMPFYIGGEKELRQELNKRIEFDKDVKEQFVIRFTINCEGMLFGVIKSKFQKGIYFDEIKKQIETIQNWKAGKQRGKNIDCFFSLNIKIMRGKLKFI